MGSGKHEYGVYATDSYVIIEEYDLEGGDPPPDGRSALAEKAFDRMMAEMNDRHQVESGRLSMNVAFTGVFDDNVRSIDNLPVEQGNLRGMGNCCHHLGS